MKAMKTNKFKKPNLTSAIDKDGNWKHVNEVESGLACNCFCPHCRARLIAINSKPESESKAHHFAHERGSDCIWSDESSLHKLAKEVLAEEQKVMLPVLTGESEAKQLEFDSVEQEARDPQTGLIPDCVCYYNGQKLWVEFKRTHEVDSKKAEKIRDAKIDCIEIDINTCKIDKETVRTFIVEDSTNRIWIYNSKTQQTKEAIGRGTRREAEYSERNYIVIDRHFAFDEQARLINFNDLSPNYKTDEHHYYCINCGEELEIVGNHFVHKVENKKCIDDIYLMMAAREVIYYNFYKNDNYKIVVPKFYFCKDYNTCKFADDTKCYTEGRVFPDLKSLGYTLCEKGQKMPGHKEAYDIILRKADSLEDAIVVNFATEDCERDLICDYRQIEINLTSEEDLAQLSDGINTGRHHNFIERSDQPADPKVIRADIFKFSLYRSGKAFLGPVPCTEIYRPRNREVIKEFLYEGIITSPKDVRLYTLLSCLKKNIEGCYCELCRYLKCNSGYPSPICIRYKKQGTPKNPLEIKPCNCKAFDLDYYLTGELEINCRDIKLIELDTKI